MNGKLNILLVDSSYPINTRNLKIINSLKESYMNSEISVVTWNRDRRLFNNEDGYYLYERMSTPGKKVLKLMNLWGYYRFIKKINQQNLYRIIIASHWDMLLLASFCKRKDQLLIYENLDIPTSYNKCILKVLQFVEKIGLKKTDLMILASRFFLPLYTNYLIKKVVLENKPINLPSVRMKENNAKFMKISYIGLVRYFDIMKILVDAVRNREGIELYIHGEGPDLERLIEYAGSCKNVVFTGRYEPTKIPELYLSSNVVWAAYPNKDYNVKYAISNKFHESIAYGVPCIYAENTELGNFVEVNQIGLTVNPYDINDIRDVIYGLNPDKYKKILRNIGLFRQQERTWSEEFMQVKKEIDMLL